MEKANNYPELLKSLNEAQRSFAELKELKYCIRTKHSEDMPLQRPRMNCSFLEGKECSMHPAHINYLEANDMGNDWTAIRFRCVLFNESGLSVAEQRDYDKASAAIQKEKLKQCRRDSQLLESIRKRVSPMIFEEIHYELTESENWSNLRTYVKHEPAGTLVKTESSLKVHVDQHSVGDSGDSWAGTQCIELPDGTYLVWDFWM